MGSVVSITPKWYFSKLKRIKHKLFHCPTFWKIKPAFTCPICGGKYRCYWDGNDIGGHIDVCNKCAETLNKGE